MQIKRADSLIRDVFAEKVESPKLSNEIKAPGQERK